MQTRKSHSAAIWSGRGSSNLSAIIVVIPDTPQALSGIFKCWAELLAIPDTAQGRSGMTMRRETA